MSFLDYLIPGRKKRREAELAKAREAQRARVSKESLGVKFQPSPVQHHVDAAYARHAREDMQARIARQAKPVYGEPKREETRRRDTSISEDAPPFMGYASYYDDRPTSYAAAPAPSYSSGGGGDYGGGGSSGSWSSSCSSSSSSSSSSSPSDGGSSSSPSDGGSCGGGGGD